MQKLTRPQPKPEPVGTPESAIPGPAKAAFDQLRHAILNDRVALVRCRYRAGGDAWVVAGVNLLTDDAELVPMALLWDDPADVLGPGE